MRLASVFIIITLITIGAKCCSRTVTLREEKASINETLNLIEKQAAYFYTNHDINKVQKINITVDDVVEESLNHQNSN